MDLKTLSLICTRDCNLEKDVPLVVGVSGGADSLTLVDSLRSLGYSLVVAHFDHRLRVDSQADTEFVREYAERNNLIFENGGGDVADFAIDHSLSVEEAARQMRYTFLFDIARKYGAQAVAVGHTADDQVETVLMHLLRGAGLAGLKGMPWSGILEVFDPVIPVVRPLLSTWRTETEDWCRAGNLAARIDATNQDTAYDRNRLRKDILPLLEKYSPQVRRHIWQMADNLQGDYHILKNLAEETSRTCMKESGDGYLCFHRDKLAKLDPALQSWIIRQGVFHLVKELRDFDAAAVKRCLEMIRTEQANIQADLPGGIRIRVEGDQLCLLTWSADLPGMDMPQLQPEFTAELTCPGRIAVGNNWFILSELVEELDDAFFKVIENVDPNQIWCDLDSLPAPLTVGCAHAGQRFQPLGMVEGTQKLSDFWVNVKLPQRARANWPVLFSGKTVVWLPGFRLAHPFRIRKETQKAIHLKLVRIEDK